MAGFLLLVILIVYEHWSPWVAVPTVLVAQFVWTIVEKAGGAVWVEMRQDIARAREWLRERQA